MDHLTFTPNPTSPPIPAATIDYGKVFLEFVAVSATAGIALVVVDARNRER
jgi:hypothetical protein